MDVPSQEACGKLKARRINRLVLRPRLCDMDGSSSCVCIKGAKAQSGDLYGTWRSLHPLF